MEPKQILIIDNDVFYQELLSDILTQQGFLVKKASDGLEGLEIVKQDALLLYLCRFDYAQN